MAKMKLPAQPDIKTTVYGNLRGVDFSVDASLVDKRRSPYAPNMVSDDGGNPVKRLGWRVLHQLNGRLNGLFYAELAGREYILAHAGNTLQLLEGTTTRELFSGIADVKSCAFYMQSAGETSKILDSRKEEVSFPKTLTLAAGSYSVKLTGGKGKDYTDYDGYLSDGGAGGTILFDLKLEKESAIEIKKITNGTDGFRESLHFYVDEVLYAASGGGGNACRAYGNDNGDYYGMDGGAGGGKVGASGRGTATLIDTPRGGNGAIGGVGGLRNANEPSSGITINNCDPGNKGGDYPDSKGGLSIDSGSNPHDLSAAGGCGYAGGGGSGEIFWERRKKINGVWDVTTYWASGSGAGGSSFLLEAENVFKIEDSQGTNKGPAYISVNRKADELQQMYLLTSRECLVFNGETVKDLEGEAYIPTVVISRKPTGGGTLYEAVNLIQKKRTESFLGDTTSKSYQLTSTNLDEDAVTVKIANAEGGHDDMKEGNGFTVNRLTGLVTFSAVHAPLIAGQDNIRITYAKTVSGYADKIKQCTVCTTYGVGGNNRVFLSGNPEYKAYDYWSDIHNPSYFPDLNYAVIGSNNTAIVGYQKVGEYLSIIKEDNQQDSTIFLRSGNLDAEGNVVFSVKPGVAGIGAVSKHCFANLGDEPLFLSRMGVYATTSALLSYERVTKNRSYFIDKKLRAEPGLSEASACEWNGYYLLAVNGNVYVLDGRHKSGEKNGNSDYIYECYFWTDVPARVWLSRNGELYFGTEKGEVCKLNTDVSGMTAYSDGGTLGEDGRVIGGRAIDAAWFTPNDDDECVHLFKTLQKKGSLVTISPYDRSSAEVCFVVDGNPEEIIKKENMDIFNWEDVNFERLTLNGNTSPQEVHFQKKKKKYKRLQIGIRNRQVDEGFGIHQIVKSYMVGNYSKNRGQG